MRVGLRRALSLPLSKFSVGNIFRRQAPAGFSSAAAAPALPPNLKLADDDLMTAPPPKSHQVTEPDAAANPREKPRAYFQRPGSVGRALEVPVVPFLTLEAESDGEDSEESAAAPPSPPLSALTLSARVFGQPLRLDVLQTVVKWQLACRRQGTSSTKRIGEVRGSGKKVRPQKGGGTARAGHRRPPHWRGGAKAHGPVTGGRDWTYKLNKKERRLGLCVALSQKLAEGNLLVVDAFRTSTHKTKELKLKLDSLGVKDALLVTEHGKEQDEAEDEAHTKFLTAARNLPKIHVQRQLGCNVYDILSREQVVLTSGAVAQLEARLLKPVRRKLWEPKM